MPKTVPFPLSLALTNSHPRETEPEAREFNARPRPCFKDSSNGHVWGTSARSPPTPPGLTAGGALSERAVDCRSLTARRCKEPGQAGVHRPQLRRPAECPTGGDTARRRPRAAAPRVHRTCRPAQLCPAAPDFLQRDPNFFLNRARARASSAVARQSHDAPPLGHVASREAGAEAGVASAGPGLRVEDACAEAGWDRGGLARSAAPLCARARP